MSLNKDLINQLVKVTSRAAINCYQFLGKENKKIADKAATDSMRNDLNNLEINGEVVIGEGELDEAPMLYIGEKLGKGNGPYLALAPTIVSGAITLGFVQQITRAFGRVENSLQYLVRSWSTIVELISVWKRLSEFEARLKYNSEESTVENI